VKNKTGQVSISWLAVGAWLDPLNFFCTRPVFRNGQKFWNLRYLFPQSEEGNSRRYYSV